MSSEPKRQPPEAKGKHFKLYSRIKETLTALPAYFKTDTFIEGISATDIFTLNSVLGATIENQVVATLNQMRPIWDPDEQYLLYSFVRQAQTFPDVKLMKSSGTRQRDAEAVLMGIELKGWYLLAKEGEPSFRFVVTPAACARQDLIVVVPWALGNVISGSPRVFAPYIEIARYAAEYRNHHWQHLREARSDPRITQPQGVRPYPAKSDNIADKPLVDGGSNFGRFARTGIMDQYLARAKSEMLCGVSAEHWLNFFKIFQEHTDPDYVLSEIEKLGHHIRAQSTEGSDPSRLEPVDKLLSGLRELLKR